MRGLLTMRETESDAVSVLLVDDDPADVLLTRKNLQRVNAGVRLQVAGDGAAAVEMLDEGLRPDLILLDLHMPRMDGKTFLKTVKADTRWQHIPVIVLSTSESEHDVYESYDLQANSYLTKPVTVENFTEIIGALDSFWFKLVRFPAASAD